MIGPAPAPVTERLVGSPRGTDERPLPIHIAVRLGGEALYLGTAKVSQTGTSDGVLTDCELRFEAPLSRQLLNRVRPPLPAVDLPGLGWLGNVNGDRSIALEQFITGWYPDADATEPSATCSPSYLRWTEAVVPVREAAAGYPRNPKQHPARVRPAHRPSGGDACLRRREPRRLLISMSLGVAKGAVGHAVREAQHRFGDGEEGPVVGQIEVRLPFQPSDLVSGAGPVRGGGEGCFWSRRTAAVVWS